MGKSGLRIGVEACIQALKRSLKLSYWCIHDLRHSCLQRFLKTTFCRGHRLGLRNLPGPCSVKASKASGTELVPPPKALAKDLLKSSKARENQDPELPTLPFHFRIRHHGRTHRMDCKFPANPKQGSFQT